VRILLTGGNGQLAQDLPRVLVDDEVVARAHAELDICNREELLAAVCQLHPSCVINTAAFNRVDECEDRPEEAFRVNAIGTYNVVLAAKQVGALVVHFSTDYVFDGSKRAPYVETDVPNPLSIYGLSKLVGEIIVRQYGEKYFLIRTCGLYGHTGSRSKGGNFVETMLRLAAQGKTIRVVQDQIVTPTSTQDVAVKVAELIRTDHYGLYHMTNSGECSWYEFAREIFQLAGLAVNLEPTSTAAYSARARRPAYSVLDNQALRRAGFADLRPWPEALADYLRARAERG